MIINVKYFRNPKHFGFILRSYMFRSVESYSKLSIIDNKVVTECTKTTTLIGWISNKQIKTFSHPKRNNQTIKGFPL